MSLERQSIKDLHDQFDHRITSLQNLSGACAHAGDDENAVAYDQAATLLEGAQLLVREAMGRLENV